MTVGPQLSGIYAALLAQMQSLNTLLIGEIVSHQRRYVRQIPAVGIAANGIAADYQPADRHVTNFAKGQASG